VVDLVKDRSVFDKISAVIEQQCGNTHEWIIAPNGVGFAEHKNLVLFKWKVQEIQTDDHSPNKGEYQSISRPTSVGPAIFEAYSSQF